MKAFLTGLVNGGATKFLTALVTAAGAASVTGGHFDWKVFTAGAIGAIGVYLFPNRSA